MRVWGIRAAGVIVPVLAAMGGSAHAVDTQPLDFVPAPDGTTAFLSYSEFGNNTGAVINKQHVPANLTSYVDLLRGVHYFDIGGYTATVSVIEPVGTLQNGSLGGSPLGHTSGFGDTIFVSALWLVNDPKANRYLTVTGYLTAPTGTYDPFSSLNLGSNRWNGAIQLAGTYGLGDKFRLEGITDVTVYGDNSQYTGAGGVMSQDPTTTAQAWLTYLANDRTNISIGYGAYWGGTERLNGIDLGLNSNKQEIRAAVSYFVTPKVQVLGQINHDFAVGGGFVQDTSALIRLMYIF